MSTTTALQTVRACIERNLDDEPQSVIKVDEIQTLHTDLKQYVLTDALAREYARVFERVIEAAAPASTGVGDVGVWVSGFFGSGKSLFAKLAGHVLADTPLGDETARSLFARQLKRGRPGDERIAALLQEATAHRLRATLVAFDITSLQTVAGEHNVGLTFLSAFYRTLGLSSLIPLAEVELKLWRAGKFDAFRQLYASRGDRVPWETDRNTTTCLPLVAGCLAELWPKEYRNPEFALASLRQSAELASAQTSIVQVVETLLRSLDDQQQQQSTRGAPPARLIFVADEVGAWAGRDMDRIEQLRAFVEALGERGRGRIWLLATSQEKLSTVVDEQSLTGANVRNLQRLEARFKVNVHLDSSEVSTVIADRVLAKRPTAREGLRQLWASRRQVLLDVAAPPGLEMGGNYPKPEEPNFLADYPFLPYQLPAAADLFGRMRGVKVSSGARSMLKVAFDATRTVADQPLGTVIPWDQIFDSANSGNEFADEHYLGSLGLEHLRQADRDVLDTPLTPSRVLKVLWLMQHNPNVPRTPGNLARLLLRDLLHDDPLQVERDVRATLEALEAKNFVRRDPASEQWKHLSQDEVTVEKLVTQISQDVKARDIRAALLKLYEDRLTHTFTGRITLGATNTAFGYGVELEGTTLKGEGQPVSLRVRLAGRKTHEQVAAENAANLDAPTVSWVVGETRTVEERLRRALAIERLPADEQFRQVATDRTREQAHALQQEAALQRRAAEAEVEKALAGGTVYYAGNVVALDEPGSSAAGSSASARAQVEAGLRDRLESVYPRFREGDKRFRADHIERLFVVPAGERAGLDSELGIFDREGHVRGMHPMVEALMAYLKITNRTSGQEIAEAFGKPPYGWQPDLLRYLAAALFVDGKVAAADRSGRRFDDPRAQGAKSLFGTQAFKTTRLDVEEDSVTPEEVSRARQLLADLGRPSADSTEAGLKEAALLACGELAKRCAVLTKAASVGFPLPQGYSLIPGMLREIEEAGSRVKVIRALIAHDAELREAAQQLARLEAFDHADGFDQFARTCQLIEVTTEAGLGVGEDGSAIGSDTTEPAVPGDATGAKIAEAREQLLHLIGEGRVLDEWDGAFKRNRGKLIEGFREVYAPLRREVRREVERARKAIMEMPEYQALPHTQQTAVFAEFLGLGKPLQQIADVPLRGDDQLVAANREFSIGHLRATRDAVPAVDRRAREKVIVLHAADQRKRGEQERTVTWNPTTAFAGKRFRTVEELEAAFNAELEALKRQIAEGKEVRVV